MTIRCNFRLLLVACLVLSLSACSTLNLNFLGHKPLKKEDARHPVREIICLWQPAEGEDLDGLPGRGFAGQILFFASGQSESVLTKGEVSILVYDDQGTTEDVSQPFHEFKFPGEVWDLYSVETNFGAAYQLFIPYTRPGKQRAACSVRVKYTPENGQPIYSHIASLVLPGTEEGKKLTTVSPPNLQRVDTPVQQADSNVMQAGHEEPATDTLTISGQSMARTRQTSGPPDVSQLRRLINASVPQASDESSTTVNEPGAAPSEDRGATEGFRLRRAGE